LEETAKLARQAGDIERALGLVREALADVDPAQQPTRASLLQQRLGGYLWRRGDSKGSLAAHAAASRLLAGHAASPERAQVLASYGSALMIAGRYSAARLRSEEAISIARTVGAVQQEGYALNALGVSLTMLGDPEAGINALRRAHSMAEAAESFEDTYRAYGNLSFAFENAGRLEEAAEAALQGLALARTRHLELVAGAVLLLNAAEYLFLLGRWQQAEDLLDSAPRLATSPRFGPDFHRVRAELAMAMGRLDEAEAHLEAARHRSPNLDDPPVVGPLYSALAELAIWRSNHASAKDAIRDGMRLIADSEASSLLLRLCAIGMRAESDEAERGRLTQTAPRIEAARRAGATLLSQAQELSQELSRRGPVPPEAKAWALVCDAEHSRLQAHADPARWQAAAEAWEKLRQPYRAAQARWRHTEALVARGARKQASVLLHQALATAQRLNAGPLREQLERLDWQITQPTASGGEPRR
jgi:tetratricopeptide (TPR) repeat protein